MTTIGIACLIAAGLVWLYSRLFIRKGPEPKIKGKGNAFDQVDDFLALANHKLTFLRRREPFEWLAFILLLFGLWLIFKDLVDQGYLMP